MWENLIRNLLFRFCTFNLAYKSDWWSETDNIIISVTWVQYIYNSNKNKSLYSVHCISVINIGRLIDFDRFLCKVWFYQHCNNIVKSKFILMKNFKKIILQKFIFQKNHFSKIHFSKKSKKSFFKKIMIFLQWFKSWFKSMI